MPNRFALALTAFAAVGLAVPGGLVTAANAGGQFQVNTSTRGNQWLNAIARLADGKFVIVWENDGGPGARGRIEAQLFSSDGARYGVDIPVAGGRGSQMTPAVAALADGSFVVVWVSNRQNPGGSIYGQRLAANGVFLGQPFLISGKSGAQETPEIAALADGGFVVVWASSPDGSSEASYDIVGQRFAADGSKVAAPFPVNGNPEGAQLRSFIAGGAGGGFTVVWDSAEDNGSGGKNYYIRGQSYSADGSRSGRPFVVRRSTGQLQRPRIAMLADGGFVVVWEGLRGALDAFNVYAQHYSAAGTQVGGLIPVARARKNDVNPAVGALAGGGFVVAWADDNFANIRAQRFAADGSATGRAVVVNERTQQVRDWPGIAPSPDGGFAISWDGQDSSALGVFGRVLKQQLGAARGAIY